MIAWLQIARIANLPSAASNILVAYLLAHGSWGGGWTLAALLGASCAIYTAGMILNDWADATRDAKHRPERPIPSGRIARSQAFMAAAGLLLAGLVLAVTAGLLSGQESPTGFNARPVTVGALLVVAIWLYDVVCKPMWFAPLLMGLCRGLNVLLGASTVPPHLIEPSAWAVPNIVWIVAAAIACYTSGVTWLARRESEPSLATHPQIRTEKVISLLSVAVAFLLLAGVFFWTQPALGAVAGQPRTNFLILLGVTALVVIRRIVAAIASSEPTTTILAVVTSLRSMMMIDAALCWGAWMGAVTPPLTIISLLAVSVFLGLVSRQT